jgi:hypothetical protein
MSTNLNVKLTDLTSVTVYDDDDDSMPAWTVLGDLRASDDDEANYDARDALCHQAPHISFDPEYSCFYAFTRSYQTLHAFIENHLRPWVVARQGTVSAEAPPIETVGDLIAHLSQFDPSLPVKVRSKPGARYVPEPVYPPFLRGDHVLIEEQSADDSL